MSLSKSGSSSPDYEASTGKGMGGGTHPSHQLTDWHMQLRHEGQAGRGDGGKEKENMSKKEQKTKRKTTQHRAYVSAKAGTLAAPFRSWTVLTAGLSLAGTH